MVLKGDNKKQFSKKIQEHIRAKLKHHTHFKFTSLGPRLMIETGSPIPSDVVGLLAEIPGIYSFSPVARCKSEFEIIRDCALDVLKQELSDIGATIKVETNRADKSIPLTSLEMTKEISRHLFKNVPNLKADVHHPDMVLNVDVRKEGTFIYTKVIKGMGGFPYGTLGKGLLLASGGIDSPVAGFLAMKRGIEIEAVHFASYPHTSKLAEQKVVDLMETLAKYSDTKTIRLHVVPFTKIQESIFQTSESDYIITIMRRMMVRISEEICKKRNMRAMITGESVGQVASQTLESLATINEPVTLPILRPLAMMDKEDIVQMAKEIKTYSISIRPYDDCCTVFVPKHPSIRPRVKLAYVQEAKSDFASLIEDALSSIKTIELSSDRHYSVLENGFYPFE